MTQVIQVPAPQEVVSALMPVVGVVAVLAVVGLATLGPIGRAIGRVILVRLGGERDRSLPTAETAELRALLEDQGGRLDAIQRQVAELAERQDFAERMLAQAREKKLLPQVGGA